MKTQILISALALCAVSTAFGADNLITNGDIETLKNDAPVGWQKSLSELRDGKSLKTESVPEAERMKATLDAVETEGTKGKALHVGIESGNGRAQWKLNLPDAKDLQAGQKYRLSFRAKYELPAPAPAELGPNARLNLWNEKFENLVEINLRSTGNYLSPVRLALPPQPEPKSDWKDYQVVFVAPEKIAYGAVNIGIAGSGGELWADDFKLEAVPTETAEGPFSQT